MQTQDTHTRNAERLTIQTWPSGRMYTYDLIDGYDVRPVDHAYSAKAARQIKIARLAEMYQRRDIFCLDSMLVDMLIERQDVDGFDPDTIAELPNMYPDTSSMDLDGAREWLADHGHDQPSTILQTTCEHCGLDIEGDPTHPSVDDCEWIWRDRGGNAQCNDGQHDHEPSADDVELFVSDVEAEYRRRAAEESTGAEVLEWYRVTGWLGEQLEAIGEVVLDNAYGVWWGRQATGQNLIMDGTLQAIASKFV